jgi:tryptophan halogenase
MRNLPIPSRLQDKIDVFKDVGGLFDDQHDIFRDASWLQVMMGQGIMPRDYHPAANVPPNDELVATLAKIQEAKQQPLAKLMPHDQFLSRYTGA